MTEHDELLRALDERAERGTPRGAEAVVAAAWHDRETPIALDDHRRRSRRGTWLVAAAAVTLIVAAVAWLRPQPTPDKVDTGATTTTTTAPPAVWQQVATLDISDRRPNMSAPTIWTGKELILVGGLQQRPNDVWATFAPMAESPALDPATGVMRLIAPPPVPLRALSVSAVWTGQEVLVTSSGEPDPGQSIGPWLGFAYNPASDTWRPITMPRDPLFDLFRADDQILAVATATVESYDVAADRWTTLGASHDGRPQDIFDTRPVLWTGRQLLAVGRNTTALYNRDAPTPTALAPAPFEARFATWTGSHALIYGFDLLRDSRGGGYRPGQGRVAQFDPATDRWEERTPAPADHTAASQAMAWADGRLVTWYGSASSTGPTGPTGPRPEPSLEGTVYDPVADTWSRAPRLPAGTGWALSGTGVGNRMHTWTVDTRVPDLTLPTDPADTYTFTLTAVSWTVPPR